MNRVTTLLLLAALLAACSTFNPPPEDVKPSTGTSSSGGSQGGGETNGSGNTNGNPETGSTNDNPETGSGAGEESPPANVLVAGTDGVYPCGINININDPHDGTEYAPYSPHDLLTKMDIPPALSNIWIYGYAVGYVDVNGQCCYTAVDAVSDNVLVSSVSVTEECDEGNTLLVELMDNEMQSVMSLAARPDSIGSLVRFNGKLVHKGKHGGYCMQTDSEDYSADWLR